MSLPLSPRYWQARGSIDEFGSGKAIPAAARGLLGTPAHSAMSFPVITLAVCVRRSPYTQALVTLAGVGSAAMVEVLELPVHPTLAM